MARKTVVKHARNYYPSRALDIDLAVYHCTQSPNPSAAGVANYFATSPIAGSTQWVFDDVLSVRCVWDHETCFGAKGHNSNGLHYEICGYAQWTRKEWLAHMPTIKAAAAQIASDMKKHGIPFVHPAPIVNGRARNGIHSHAGLPGNDHYDPGKNFPIDVLLSEIKKGLGPVHAVKTSKPVIAAKDVRKRNNLTIAIMQPDGRRLVRQGWRSKAAGGGAQGMLAWLAEDGRQLRPGTVVRIIWQGKVFDSTQIGNENILNVARSIHTRYA